MIENKIGKKLKEKNNFKKNNDNLSLPLITQTLHHHTAINQLPPEEHHPQQPNIHLSERKQSKGEVSSFDVDNSYQ
jgi:hypothetical protein